MTEIWLHDNTLLRYRRPPPERKSLASPPGHLLDPHPLRWELPSQPVHQQRITSSKFLPHAYLDAHGRLKTGNAIAHLLRRMFLPVNTFIVLMGGVLGLVGGISIGYTGRPVVGVFFSLLMIYGACAQRSAFDYKRIYGVWRGSCPHCKEPLNINANVGRANTAPCSCCTSYVMAKDGIFRIVPWYTQLL